MFAVRGLGYIQNLVLYSYLIEATPAIPKIMKKAEIFVIDVAAMLLFGQSQLVVFSCRPCWAVF